MSDQAIYPTIRDTIASLIQDSNYSELDSFLQQYAGFFHLDDIDRATDAISTSPLALAVYAGSVETLQILIKYGASINFLTADTESAFQIALTTQHYHIAAILLFHYGSDIITSSREADTASNTITTMLSNFNYIYAATDETAREYHGCVNKNHLLAVYFTLLQVLLSESFFSPSQVNKQGQTYIQIADAHITDVFSAEELAQCKDIYTTEHCQALLTNLHYISYQYLTIFNPYNPATDPIPMVSTSYTDALNDRLHSADFSAVVSPPYLLHFLLKHPEDATTDYFNSLKSAYIIRRNRDIFLRLQQARTLLSTSSPSLTECIPVATAPTPSTLIQLFTTAIQLDISAREEMDSLMPSLHQAQDTEAQYAVILKYIALLVKQNNIAHFIKGIFKYGPSYDFDQDVANTTLLRGKYCQQYSSITYSGPTLSRCSVDDIISIIHNIDIALSSPLLLYNILDIIISSGLIIKIQQTTLNSRVLPPPAVVSRADILNDIIKSHIISTNHITPFSVNYVINHFDLIFPTIKPSVLVRLYTHGQTTVGLSREVPSIFSLLTGDTMLQPQTICAHLVECIPSAPAYLQQVLELLLSTTMHDHLSTDYTKRLSLDTLIHSPLVDLKLGGQDYFWTPHYIARLAQQIVKLSADYTKEVQSDMIARNNTSTAIVPLAPPNPPPSFPPPQFIPPAGGAPSPRRFAPPSSPPPLNAARGPHPSSPPPPLTPSTATPTTGASRQAPPSLPLPTIPNIPPAGSPTASTAPPPPLPSSSSNNSVQPTPAAAAIPAASPKPATTTPSSTAAPIVPPRKPARPAPKPPSMPLPVPQLTPIVENNAQPQPSLAHQPAAQPNRPLPPKPDMAPPTSSPEGTRANRPSLAAAPGTPSISHLAPPSLSLPPLTRRVSMQNQPPNPNLSPSHRPGVIKIHSSNAKAEIIPSSAFADRLAAVAAAQGAVPMSPTSKNAPKTAFTPPSPMAAAPKGGLPPGAVPISPVADARPGRPAGPPPTVVTTSVSSSSPASASTTLAVPNPSSNQPAALPTKPSGPAPVAKPSGPAPALPQRRSSVSVTQQRRGSSTPEQGDAVLDRSPSSVAAETRPPRRSQLLTNTNLPPLPLIHKLINEYNIAGVHALLLLGCDPNKVDPIGFTPLLAIGARLNSPNQPADMYEVKRLVTFTHFIQLLYTFGGNPCSAAKILEDPVFSMTKLPRHHTIFDYCLGLYVTHASKDLPMHLLDLVYRIAPHLINGEEYMLRHTANAFNWHTTPFGLLCNNPRLDLIEPVFRFFVEHSGTLAVPDVRYFKDIVCHKNNMNCIKILIESGCDTLIQLERDYRGAFDLPGCEEEYKQLKYWKPAQDEKKRRFGLF